MKFTPNQKKAHDLNRHISVTAGAGSGKTAVLANRYLSILLEKNVRVNQVVAITFTEKAAAELKGRIVREINARLADEENGAKLVHVGRNYEPPEPPSASPPFKGGETEGGSEAADRVQNLRRDVLEAIKEGMTSAPISTIHSFCARILREYPIEASVDANFSVLQGIEGRFLLRETIDSTLKSIADLPKGDTIRECLAYLLRIFSKGRLEEILGQLVHQRYTLDRLMRELYSLRDEDLLDYWRKFIQDGLTASLSEQFPIEEWQRCLNTTLAVVKGKNAAEVRELTDQIQPNLDARDLIAIFSEIADLIVTKSGTISKRDFIGGRVKTDKIESEIGFLVRAANHFRSFPPLTGDDALLIRVTRPLLEIYQQIQHDYELRKVGQGLLDFEDLQLKVRDLLQHEPIRERLAQRYSYIMVDEYQDTNRLQYDILKPLISDFQSGNLFIVGDQKQSIYGFRGADVRVFHQTLEEITAYQKTVTDDFVWGGENLQADESEQRGDIHLPGNFRLLRNLVGLVNLVFQHTMGEATLNEFEVAYEPLIKGRANDAPGDVEILIGTKASTGNEGKDQRTEEPVYDGENDLIAGRIRHLIGTKATIWEPGGGGEKPRKIRYGDIAILIRSRTRLPEIETALLKGNIPYKITGGVGFYQRQEIYDIGNYLQFLANPQDDVALVGVLRAPFFGISDVELYETSLQPASGSFWQKVQVYAEQRCKNTEIHGSATRNTQHATRNIQSSILPNCYAVETLEHHLQICHRLPVSALIRTIVNETGMIGVLSVGQQGEQRWANYEKLLRVAREFDQAGFTDLVDFLERLNLLIEEEEREGQAATQLTDDAVQVMTTHAAKGLEFPIVMLPHLDRKFRYDQEPFIDDALSIGFNPANPEKGYEKSNPTVTQLMRERARNKTVAEEKRLFYVAATRARDRLILSGTLDRKGRAHGWLGWLFDGLGISGTPAEDGVERPVTIEALTEDRPSQISFDLPIDIIKSLEALDFVEEEPPPLPPVTFPAFHIEPLECSSVGETFSVTQLATHAHCPTKFYLKHQLHVPETVGQDVILPLQEDSDRNSTARGAAVHEVLAQLRTQADCERDLEPLISVAVRSTNGAVSAQTVRIHVDGFLTSEIGEMALNAQPGYCERHLYAQIGAHVINGIVDRIFKDAAGLWQIIDYKTDDVHPAKIAARADYYRPQLELYALLVQRLYPDQHMIPVTIFFSHLAEVYQAQLTAEELEGVEGAWLKRIESIQEGKFEKNMAHCPVCPYFLDEQCLVSD